MSFGFRVLGFGLWIEDSVVERIVHLSELEAINNFNDSSNFNPKLETRNSKPQAS